MTTNEDTAALIAEARERAGYMAVLAKLTANEPGAITAREEADRITRLADALETTRAQLEKSKRGGAELGKMIKQQCDDIVAITGSQDLIGEDGDGDWGLVWERAFDMRDRLAALTATDENLFFAKQTFDEISEERGAALAAIERVRALHYKITRYGNDMYSISAEGYEDDPSSYEDMEPFDLCAECYEVEKLICDECGGDAPIGHRSNWPCPTIAALDGAPEPERAWEYALGGVNSDGSVWCDDEDETTSDPGEAREWAKDAREGGTFSNAIAVKRRFNPWLPVDGESK